MKWDVPLAARSPALQAEKRRFPHVAPIIGRVEMRSEHVEKGGAWLKEHKDHVLKLVAQETHAYEPSAAPYHKGGDAHDPRLWTAAHWRWFIQTHAVGYSLK